jgi:hypothetical protein
MPPPQSKAWSYSKRDVESKIVKCKLCNLEMTYRTVFTIVVISYGCENTNARGIVIVSYYSYLIIDLIRYLSLFTVTLTCTLNIFLTFMN